jgi:hypothetical protein
MNSAVDMLVGTLNKATNVVAGGALGSLMPTGVSKFDDSGLTGGMVVLVLVILAIYVALLVAVYRLTGGSWLHTILCLFFGSFYLICVVIYFGLTGHKIVKVNGKNN